MLYADYSDPDAIRVGDDYYMTASSFNHAPGLPILHSKDMINWTIINHALPVIPPKETYQKVLHGLGVYAPSIRYHDGTFFIFYGDPDFGIYMVSTKDPRGKWTEPLLIKEGPGYIDTCPLWDDDGKAYLVNAWAGSRVKGANKLTLHEMSPDGTKLIGEGKVIIQGREMRWSTLEGPKLYKRDGWYWVFAPGGGVGSGYQAVARSRNIWGPYEGRIVLEQGTTHVNGPHQGAWLDTPKGEDWFLHFQKLGAWGRVTHLQPIKWTEAGWPVMGNDPDNDGKGEPFLTHKKPDLPVQPIAVPATTDEFDEPTLGLQWQWEANFITDWWDLKAKKGSLRLNSIPLAEPNVRWTAPNILLQKFPAPSFTATTVLHFSPKTEGEVAGLTVFGRNYAWLGLRKTGGKTQLELVTFRSRADKEEVVNASAQPKGNTVFLRVSVDTEARCRFEWSEDGENFQAIDRDFRTTNLGWVGAKIGVFATAEPGSASTGHADFDWFRVTDYIPNQ
ncbi:MAG: glycoside hydrolase 43 family protein [Luteolibacter sp.]